MKFSCLPYLMVNFSDEDAVRNWCQVAQRAGLDGIELMYRFPIHWHIVHRTEKLMKKHHLQPSIITIHNCFMRQTSEEQKAELNIVTSFLELASALGAGMVRVIMGWWTPPIREISRASALAAAITTIKMCLEPAARLKVVMALENHPGMGVSREMIHDVFSAVKSPFLGWNFDMENPYRIPGQDAFSFLNDPVIARRLCYVHAKNFKNTPKGWDQDIALDQGDLDVVSMLAAVKRLGHDDWLSFEYASKDAKHIMRSARYLRKAWAKA